MKWLAAVSTVGIVILLSVRKSYLRRRQQHMRRIRGRQRELRAERNRASEWPPSATTVIIFSSDDMDPRHRDTIEVTQEWVNDVSARFLSCPFSTPCHRTPTAHVGGVPTLTSCAAPTRATEPAEPERETRGGQA